MENKTASAIESRIHITPPRSLTFYEYAPALQFRLNLKVVDEGV
jgi:hypothetical protein